MSDGDDGGLVNGAAEPSGGVSGSATPTPEPSKGRGKRKLGLAAVVIGVLGAAVWFVGPSLIPEQCFVDGVETPCDVADVQFVVAPPLADSCFVDDVEIPCEDMPTEGEQCWADETFTVEIPCPDEEGLPDSCFLDGVEIPCEDRPALNARSCWLDEALTVEVPCGINTEASPLLAGSDATASGFPQSRLDDARTLREQIVGSVFAVGPVLPSGRQDARNATATAWAIHPRFAVTNQHVVDDATEMTLYLYPNKRSIRGRVVAVDVEQDIAVLELLELIDVEPLVVADRPAIAGDPAMYVGHPTQMGQMWSTGLGVVAGYEIPLERATVFSTVPSRDGASGSPIVNLDGEVVSLLSGGRQQFCPFDRPECAADATVQYSSLPVGPTVTYGIDGPAIRKFFTQATGETLPPSGSARPSAGDIVTVHPGSIGSFAVYREREQAGEAGRLTTVSGFPVVERATVAAMYDRLADAVFVVKTPDGVPTGAAWLVGPTTVVTNEHVSTPARSGDIVILRRRDGSTVQARIIEESVLDDVTVLRLDSPLDAPPLRIAQRNVDIDVPVFYIGHPGWMEQWWITGLGVTTGYDTISTQSNRMLTTVPGAPGASGSPIFNLNGEVVALLSAAFFPAVPGGYPVADGSTQYSSVPVGRSTGGVDASTLRSYVERHLS